MLRQKALHGEGPSRHYLPPGYFAHPDRHLAAMLAEALTGAGAPWHPGATWTTDALYRERAVEASLYARHGVLTVEMEAAGLFAVGRHRHLLAAAAFAVANSLVNRTSRTGTPDIAVGLQSAGR
ncbi:hypothetical protein ABT263_37820 [Kitasatospora sp. NPDC001603]|uniref:phosphorylase family protein n=1 Tax=Kitasatospora sp. NPDC001603 TaxID=3154388 RepID=UPI003322BA79